jgi:hypothetical protein
MVKTPPKLIRGQTSLTDFFKPSPDKDVVKSTCSNTNKMKIQSDDDDDDDSIAGHHDENVHANSNSNSNSNSNMNKNTKSKKKKVCSDKVTSTSNCREVSSPAKKRAKKDADRSSTKRKIELDRKEEDDGNEENEDAKYPIGTKVSKVCTVV